jgi:hypothetical protein
MPRLSVKRVMRSNMLKQVFIVHRKIGRWVAGRFEQTERHFAIMGIVVNETRKEIVGEPVGDRIMGNMSFYSDEQMYITHDFAYPDTNASGTSDELEWQGDRFRVMTVNDYGDYGNYHAIAVYMEGD